MHNNLVNLLLLNQGKSHYRVENMDSGIVVMYLYGILVADDYWGGIGGATIAKELAAINADEIYMRWDCPGGDMFAGRVIEQAVKEHSAKITAFIDGRAASAATYPVIAADESYITESGLFMIHQAETMEYGNADALEKTVSFLRRTDNVLAATYAQKTGKSEDEILQMMKDTTYFYGQEAVDAGFITGINDQVVKNTISWSVPNEKPPQNPIQNQEEPETPIDLSRHKRNLELRLKAV